MTAITPGTRVRVTLEAEVKSDRRNWTYGADLLIKLDQAYYSIPADAITSVEPIAPEEPTDPAVRAIDREGEVWAAWDGKWWCLNGGRFYRPWDALVRDFGPIEIGVRS